MISLRPRTGYFLSVSAALVWSMTGPGLSYLLTEYHVPTLTLAFWRDAFIATVGITCILLLRPTWLLIGWRELRNFAYMGAISVGIYHAIFVSSVELNGAALAIVLIYTYPVFVTIGASIFFKEPLHISQILALITACSGCLLIMRIYDITLFQSSWLGVIVGIGSAVTHAGYVLFNQHAVTRHNPWTTLTLTMFFGTLTLLVLTTALSGFKSLGEVGPGGRPWLLLLALSLGPTMGGYALFTMSLQHISGQIASLIAVLEVPIATLLAMVILHEQLEWPQLIGILLVVIAAVFPTLLRLPHQTIAKTH